MAIGGQFLPQKLQPRRLAGQTDGQLFIILQTAGHQFRQAHRVQQAGGDAAGKGLCPGR